MCRFWPGGKALGPYADVGHWFHSPLRSFRFLYRFGERRGGGGGGGACVRTYFVTTAHDLGNHEMAHIVAHLNADNILVVKGLALPESVLASMFTAEQKR